MCFHILTKQGLRKKIEKKETISITLYMLFYRSDKHNLSKFEHWTFKMWLEIVIICKKIIKKNLIYKTEELNEYN